MQDTYYVVEEGLKKAGLNINNLSEDAKRLVIVDCQRYIEPRLSQVKDIDILFEKFVTPEGNYYNTMTQNSSFMVIGNADKSFKVVIKSTDSFGTRFTEKSYSSLGIEIQRRGFYEGTDVVDVTTREENMVVLRQQRINTSDNSIISDEYEFIDPMAAQGRTLNLGGGYEKTIGEKSYEPRAQQEIDTIIDYLQLITGLSPKMYTKDGEINYSGNLTR